MKTFTTWLTSEMRKRDITQAELARLAGLSRTAVSNVLSGARTPGPDFCRAIARALDYPPEVVFRRAGLLPPKPEADEEIEQAVYLLAQMSPEARREALAFLRFKAAMDEGVPPPRGGGRKTKESRESPALGG